MAIRFMTRTRSVNRSVQVRNPTWLALKLSLFYLRLSIVPVSRDRAPFFGLCNRQSPVGPDQTSAGRLSMQKETGLRSRRTGVPHGLNRIWKFLEECD